MLLPPDNSLDSSRCFLSYISFSSLFYLFK